MKREKRKENRWKQAFALLLALTVVAGGLSPGKVLAAEASEPEAVLPMETTEQTTPNQTVTEPLETGATEPEVTTPSETTPENTVPETSMPAETMPEETVPEETVLEETLPEETLPTQTTPEETIPETTAPEETLPSAYEELMSQLLELEEKAKDLEPELEALDGFSQQLRELWNRAYDENEAGLISDEELESIDEKAYDILLYLKTDYGYEDGVITTLEAQRFGSRETPMAATAQNSVASLGSGSGIKFRIFNYTNGKDVDGNYSKAGGINDNGLSGYFDFRGTSYENTGADGTAVSNFTNSITDIDGFTANHATVLHTLDGSGYPVFDGSRDNGPNKSLGYLFGAGGKGVTAYTASNTLLRQDASGRYYYNSADNAVDFDTDSRRFIVRTYKERGQTTANQGSGQYYDFFPFTYWDGTTKENSETAKWYNYNNTKEVDYWYGMTMEAAFSMPKDGLVNGNDNMVFEFSGDDDVWVFIDDVLVLDLGGTHGVVTGSINFATGEIKQYLDWNGTTSTSAGTTYPTTLETRFREAGKEPRGGWAETPGSSGKVFADYTEHTIKFFYLERATSCANCKISFNMPILPTGELTVEKKIDGTLTEETENDAYGFTLWEKANGSEREAAGIRFDIVDVATDAVVGTGTTKSDGSFSLLAGQKALFNLTAGKTYIVTETDPGISAEALACRVNGAQQPLPDSSGEITIDPEIPVEAEFTNRLNTTQFTVVKKVAGNLGDREQPFGFTAKLYAADPSGQGGAIPFPDPGTGEAYTVQDGIATFHLNHGETGITFDQIPLGAWVIVTETENAGYETSFRLGETEGKGTRAEIASLTEPVVLTFTNTKNVVIQTGIALDQSPYVLLLAGTGGLFLLRRRRKYEG